MNAMELLTGPFAQALGWALLHLLWQATIVAGILAAALALIPRKNAGARYAASCAALALVFGMFVTTTVRSWDPAAPPVATVGSSGGAEEVIVPLVKVPVVIAATAAASWRDRALDFMATARQSLPSLVALWLAGVIILATRLLVSWARARALVTRGSYEAGEDWQRVVRRLSSALGLRRAVQLLESAAVEVPSVIGSLRPVILLPASALTGMTPEQIEMILAHELAHIRRHDFLVNLLQASVETLMFYHPAVWWISHAVRAERENCCDDLALAVCGNPIEYARALTRLEELRIAALPVVVAANGGSLLDRVRRIVSSRAESVAAGPRWLVAVAVLVVIAAAVSVPSLPAFAQREDAPEVPAPPTPAHGQVDVVVPVPAVTPVPPPHPRVPSTVPVPVDVDIDVPTPELPDLPELPELPEHDFDFDFDFDYDDAVIESIGPAVQEAIAVTPLPRMTPVAMARAAARARDDEDEEETPDRKLSEPGKLTVDELISLRAVGVTPEYMDTMREFFPDLTVRQVTGLKAVGVTPELIRELRAAGLDVNTASAATSLRAVGVDSEFIRDMRAAGFEVKSAKDATSLRAVGVDGRYVADMRAAGLAIANAHDATSLRAVGVTPQYLREIRAAGVKVENARDATTLRALGVTPSFVKQLSEAGYRDLSVRELSRLASAGVDGDFVREMEQYRDKSKDKSSKDKNK